MTGGDVYANDVAPNANATYDLGAPGAAWNNVYISGSIIGGSLAPSTLALGVQQISAIGALYVVNPNIGVTEFSVTVSSTATLASAASAGQFKVITIISLTPTTTLSLSASFVSGTSLTFDAAGQSAILMSVTGGGWIVIPGGALFA